LNYPFYCEDTAVIINRDAGTVNPVEFTGIPFAMVTLLAHQNGNRICTPAAKFTGDENTTCLASPSRTASNTAENSDLTHAEPFHVSAPADNCLVPDAYGDIEA